MTLRNISLLLAPIDYRPGCAIRYEDENNITRFAFSGDRVVFDWLRAEGRAVAVVDGKIVGEWTNPTIGKWYDILYTLENKFNHLIEK